VSSVSNGLHFLTLPLVSVMHVICTSKGMSKKFGVRVVYRKICYLLQCREYFAATADSFTHAGVADGYCMTIKNFCIIHDSEP
jgi:hypothetical protein